MAGIGFRLEKILSKNSYTNLLEGYAYSAIVSAGPVLFTIFSIAILSAISLASMDQADIMIFRTLVVYIYGASLITSSPAQMIITRYMADRIFMKDFEAIVPSFVGIIILSAIVHALIGITAVQFLHLDFSIKVMAVVLFINIGIIWIAMIALSAAKEFLTISKSYMISSITSVVLGYLLGNQMSLLGLVTGFTIGQIILVILLVNQIFAEFNYRLRVEFHFLEYFKKYASLAFIATLYNIGIWADKFIFWFDPETKEQVLDFLHASSIYDMPVFLAYLFIVPSLAMFTIRVETSFYIHYKKYFLSILNKHPLISIEERRNNIINDLKLGLARMIVLQGTITAAGIFIAPYLYKQIGMTALNLSIFQIMILATFVQALLQTLLILMLYFDFRNDALAMTMLFALSNIILTKYSITLGFGYFGYGYFGSCLLSLIVGFIMFNYRLKNLLYYTFVSQKIIVHKESTP